MGVVASHTVCADESAEPAPSVVRMKTGDCTFRLLQSDGIKPIVGTQVSLRSSEDGVPLAQAVTDKRGKCVLEVISGRHILNVADSSVLVVDASETARITDCRIVVPEEGLPVGGEGEEGQAPPRNCVKFSAVVVGTVAVVTGYLTRDEIVDLWRQQFGDEDGQDDGEEGAEEPTQTGRRKKKKEKKDDDDGPTP